MPTLDHAHELTTGMLFPSPREDEGFVVAVCDFGRCDHGHERPDSVHVRMVTTKAEFFIALPPYYPMHVCNDTCPAFPDCLDFEELAEHRASNRRLG